MISVLEGYILLKRYFRLVLGLNSEFTLQFAVARQLVHKFSKRASCYYVFKQCVQGGVGSGELLALVIFVGGDDRRLGGQSIKYYDDSKKCWSNNNEECWFIICCVMLLFFVQYLRVVILVQC